MNWKDRLYHWFLGQQPTEEDALVAYRMMPENVLKHLAFTIYFTTCPSKDPVDIATHNARRSVVEEMLINYDMATNPAKYAARIQEANGETIWKNT
jgi:hypothetical protein